MTAQTLSAPPRTAAPACLTFTPTLLAQLLGGRLIGRPDLVLTGFAGIDDAGPGTLTFIRSESFASHWPASKASAALVSQNIEVPGHDPTRRALIVVPDADLAMRQLLVEAAKRVPVHQPPSGVHPSAIVDPSARLAPGVAIGPTCIVGPGCRLGEGVVLHARVTLGMDVTIGAGTVIFPSVVVYDRCSIGARCIIHAGVIIGADGFGYLPDPATGALLKVPHIGTVEIHDDVEIGANSCVDRAKFGATVIGQGTKIDNFVQIAHNVKVGRSVILCGLTGLGGSVTIGDGAILAGDVGVVDGINIGAGAKIAAKSGVLNDVPAGESWIGYPAMASSEGRRNFAAFRHLAEILRDARSIRKELASLRNELESRRTPSPGA